MYSSVDDIEVNQVTISPNPAYTNITIEGGENYELVSVYDQSGRKVIERKLGRSPNLDISSLQPGSYIVVLEGDDNPQVSKFVKL